MNALRVWNEFFELNDQKSEVNIVQLDDKSFWFQFSHLAKLLGYSNPTVAIQTHCEDYEIQKLDIGKHEPVNFVSESGFYSLVLGSQKPIAKKFKKWVCAEVLPKLRAEGGYIMPSATLQQLEGLQAQVEHHKNRVANLAATHKDIQYKTGLYEHPRLALESFVEVCSTDFSEADKQEVKDLIRSHSGIGNYSWKVPVSLDSRSLTPTRSREV